MRIGTATVVDNDNILPPLGDGTNPLAMAWHCPQNINFAHVNKVNLNFDFLADDADLPCHFETKFFVRLPQHIVPVMNGGNVVVNHLTFTGLDNIRTMPALIFLQDVLSESL